MGLAAWLQFQQRLLLLQATRHTHASASFQRLIVDQLEPEFRHWWWLWNMETSLDMSAPTPSTFLSSKTLLHVSNTTTCFKKLEYDIIYTSLLLNTGSGIDSMRAATPNGSTILQLCSSCNVQDGGHEHGHFGTAHADACTVPFQPRRTPPHPPSSVSPLQSKCPNFIH
jgi:hypothetical protein